MAKKHEHENTDDTCGVERKGSKYVCKTCGAILEVEHNCPGCKREINWPSVMTRFGKVNPF